MRYRSTPAHLAQARSNGTYPTHSQPLAKVRTAAPVRDRLTARSWPSRRVRSSRAERARRGVRAALECAGQPAGCPGRAQVCSYRTEEPTSSRHSLGSGRGGRPSRARGRSVEATVGLAHEALPFRRRDPSRRPPAPGRRRARGDRSRGAILVAVNGRDQALRDLEGPGVATLTRRTVKWSAKFAGRVA